MAYAPTVEERKTRAETTAALLNLFAENVVRAFALFMTLPDSYRLIDAFRIVPPEDPELPLGTELCAWARERGEVSLESADTHLVLLERHNREEGRLCMILDEQRGPGFLAEDAFQLFKEQQTEIVAEARRILQLQSETEKAAEQRRALLDASPHAMAVIHRDSGCIERANPGFEELTGIAVEDAIGKSLWELDAFVDGERLRAAFQRTAAGKRPAGVRLTKRDGSSLTVRLTAAFSDFNTACVALADHTSQTDLRNRLLEVEKRSAAHGVLGKIVHDITNALTGITGFAAVLATTAEALEEISESVQQIVSETRRCRELIHQLSKAASPPRRPARRIDVSELVASAADFAGLDAQVHGVEIVTQLSDGIPPITGDRHGLRCILDEAALNAAEAFKTSGTTGRIAMRARSEHDSVTIEIEDDAGGAPEPDRVFEPFYSARPGGTGLGLTMIKVIAEEHQGSASFENTERGAVLRVVLPAAEAGHVRMR